MEYLLYQMAKKIGRNDPCPCGSGKKYKKCCALTEIHEPLFPPLERTGTLFDDYMEIIPLVALYEQRVMDFEKDGRELKKAVSRFEKRFHPGEENGLTDSFFMSWLHFDFRFGKSFQTIAERLLQDPMTASLVEPGPTLIRRLSESYFSFYEVIESGPRTVLAEELGTGRRFTVFSVRELFEFDPEPGEIWHVRLVGPPQMALCFTTPYVYPRDARGQFERAVWIQKGDFRRSPLGSRFPPERHFAESQKAAALFWAEFIYRGKEPSLSGSTMSEDSGSDLPSHLYNMDGEELELTEVHFRIRNEPALRKKLGALRSFEYDEIDGSWIWMKAGKGKDPNASRTILGFLSVQNGALVAEVNSRERAGRIRAKLKSHLGDLIAYDKTLYRDQNDLPELSKEEAEALAGENEALNALPEVRERIRAFQENYYFKEWPRQKIPMLGGLTPLQAAKTESGRTKLKELLEYYDLRKEAGPPSMPKIDTDSLRRMLGLPPKAN